MRSLESITPGVMVLIALTARTHAGGIPPVNDACSNATVIPGGVVTFNPALAITTGAINELCSALETCEVGAVGVSNSVWYSYTPTLAGTIVIDTFGSDFNTVLSVFTGCGSGFPPFCSVTTQLACNDDFFFGNTSQVILDVEAGESYIIKVADYNGADGGGILDFNLRWIPPNDVCGDATLITTRSFNPPVFSTIHADTEVCEALESCEVNGVGVSDTVWYEFVACADGAITIDTNGSTYDTVLSIFTKCGVFVGVDIPCNFGQPPPVQLGCDDDGGVGVASLITDFPVDGGESYFIKVADYNPSPGGGMLDFNLAFTPDCTGDLDCDNMVGGSDLGQLLLAWDLAGGPADLNGDNIVNGADLGILLLAWGPCA
jgi:hypothetical protein